MYNIHYLNKISPKGTELWTENYQTTEDIAAAVKDAGALADAMAAFYSSSLEVSGNSYTLK